MTLRMSWLKLSEVDWEVTVGLANHSREEALATLSKVQAASEVANMGRGMKHDRGVQVELDAKPAQMS